MPEWSTAGPAAGEVEDFVRALEPSRGQPLREPLGQIAGGNSTVFQMPNCSDGSTWRPGASSFRGLFSRDRLLRSQTPGELKCSHCHWLLKINKQAILIKSLSVQA